MQDDEIIKDEGEVEDLDIELVDKKKIDPLDDAESVEELEEEEEVEEEPFDDVNPI